MQKVEVGRRKRRGEVRLWLGNWGGAATELGPGVTLSENNNSGAPSPAALLLRTSRQFTNDNLQSHLHVFNEGR